MKLELQELLMEFFINQKLRMISLHRVDFVNSNAMFGIFIGDKKVLNKKIGFHSSLLTLDFVNGMGLNRIELLVLVSNKNAIHLYKNLFQRKVPKERLFFDGEFVDVEMMAILKKRFLIKIVIKSSCTKKKLNYLRFLSFY